MLLSTDGDWLNSIFNAKNKVTKKYIIKIKFPLPKGKKFKQNINHNGEVLKIRDEHFIKYFSDKNFQKKIFSKFGQAAVDNINQMLKVKLKRKIIEEL